MTGYMMYMILKCAAADSGKQIQITMNLKWKCLELKKKTSKQN